MALRGVLKCNKYHVKIYLQTHPLDLDELAAEDRKQTMCWAWDEGAREGAVGTGMEALVPACAGRTFAVGEVEDVVVPYAVDIGPREKSYLSTTVVKFV